MTTPEGNTPQTASGSVTSDHRLLVIICYALYLAGILIGFTSIVGVIIAYVKRGEAKGTVWESHYTNLIMTFWITLGGAVVGAILTFIVIGILVLIAVVVWFLYRTIVGLMKAIDAKPYDNPEKLF